MSEPTVIAAAPSRPRRRRRWLLLGVPMAIALAVLAFFLVPDPSEQELRDAIAEADRLDPGWRWEELEARRKVIPGEENAALCVLAVHKLMPPGDWPPLPRLGDQVNPTIAYLPPPVQLHESVLREIEASLASVEPARIEAGRLKGLSAGRYPEAWDPQIGSGKTERERINNLVNMLQREAIVLAQSGQVREALATGRALLVVGRSIGDEPALDPVSRACLASDPPFGVSSVHWPREHRRRLTCRQCRPCCWTKPLSRSC